MVRYVYLMLCDANGRINVKIGLSKNPVTRLKTIRGHSAIEPQLLAAVQVPGLYAAQCLERDLHAAFDDWRTTGEWFSFTPEDKAEFNRRCRDVLDSHSVYGELLRWRTISMAEVMKPRKRQMLPLIGSVLNSKGFSGAFDKLFPSTY